MQGLFEDNHGIFTIFPNLWHKSHQPRGASHPYGTDDTNSERRLADLEGLEEEQEVVRRRRQRYQQRMFKAYAQIVHPRAFTEGQLVLKAAEHVRKNIPGPSKFTLKWEGPYIIRKAYDSGYYYLTKEDRMVLTNPINGKWLKQYHT